MKSKISQSDINLDSFLDIITNVIGVLVLIACAISLQIKNYEPPKKTPTLEKPPANLRFKFFVCGVGRCQPIQNPSRALYPKMKDSALEHFGGSTNWTALIKYCNEKKDWDPDFDIELERFSDDVVEAKVKLKPQTDDLATLLLEQLQSLNPDQNGIYFYVHRDGFEAFRTARAIAKSAGFRVGWRPITADHLTYIVENPRRVPLSGGTQLEIEAM